MNDLLDVVDYIMEHEYEDFLTQLRDGGIGCIDRGSERRWEEMLKKFERLDDEMTRESVDDEFYKVVNYLAYHGTNHIYCSAYRLSGREAYQKEQLIDRIERNAPSYNNLLQEAVHNAKAGEASLLCNDGVSSQIEYLLEYHGGSLRSVREAVGLQEQE